MRTAMVPGVGRWVRSSCAMALSLSASATNQSLSAPWSVCQRRSTAARSTSGSSACVMSSSSRGPSRLPLAMSAYRLRRAQARCPVEFGSDSSERNAQRSAFAPSDRSPDDDRNGTSWSQPRRAGICGREHCVPRQDRHRLRCELVGTSTAHPVGHAVRRARTPPSQRATPGGQSSAEP